MGGPTYGQTNELIDRYMDRETHRYINRQTERNTNRQIDRKTYKRRDRQRYKIMSNIYSIPITFSKFITSYFCRSYFKE
jgi:hypothetical protein